MLPIVAVTGLFSSYVLIMVLMFSQLSRMSNLSATHAASSTVSANSKLINQQLLGLYGRDLLKYFKRNLPKIVSSSDILRSNNANAVNSANVSLLYDAFHSYLLKDDQTKTVQKLTQDVTVLPNIHSHNDYWRMLPLFEALIHGVTSVEADIWLTENSTSLSVSHDRRHIDSKHKTLDLLYTEPLLRMLNQVNSVDISSSMKEYSPHSEEHDTYLQGVFFSDSSQSLQLLLDFKSDDNAGTYQLLMSKYLRPLIQRNYLTYFDLLTQKIVKGPITIVLTGNYPADTSILDYNAHGSDSETEKHELKTGFFRDNKRYVFLDVPLHDTELQDKLPQSVLASASLSQLLSKCQSSEFLVKIRGYLSEDELKCFAVHMKHAKKNNLATRIWGVPSWPIATRDRLWHQQYYDLHVDYLNVDDLKAAAKF